MITGLIIAGLVIDLGGGPDGDRRGFRVSFFPLVKYNDGLTELCNAVLEEPWCCRSGQFGTKQTRLGQVPCYPYSDRPSCLLLPGYGACLRVSGNSILLKDLCIDLYVP